jgi:hypothetical protein
MFTTENSDYSQCECDELNAEFDARMAAAGITREDDLGDEWRNAEKAFADDVAGR